MESQSVTQSRTDSLTHGRTQSFIYLDELIELIELTELIELFELIELKRKVGRNDVITHTQSFVIFM